MSSTLVQKVEPRTITLTNGKTFTFNSNASTTDEQIPVIDVSRMYSERLEDRQALAEEIREAAHVIGFLCIVNHVRLCGCRLKDVVLVLRRLTLVLVVGY